MAIKCIQYELKRWGMPFLVNACLLIVLCTAVVWVHGMEAPVQLYMEEVPNELSVLVGLEKGNGQEICRQLFFVLFSIISMISMGVACAGIMDGVKKEELEGTLVYYINQPWSKGNFWTIKFGAAAFRVTGLWVIYLMECLVAVRFMQAHLPAYSGEDYSLVFSMGARGLGILVFTFGMCLMYCAKTNDGIGIGNFVMTIYALMFLLGNAYKVSELALYYMRAAQRDAGVLEKLGGIMDKLRFLYPFAYLDMLHGNNFSLAATVWYGIAGCVMIISAWGLFCRKEIQP